MADPSCANPELDGLLVPSPADVGRDYDRNSQCWTNITRDDLRGCTFGDMADTSIPHIVLIGDSHARTQLGVFIQLAELGQARVTAQLKGSCAWTTQKLIHKESQRVDTCESWRGKLFQWLDEKEDIDLVVTAAYGRALKGPSETEISGLIEAWSQVTSKGIPIVAFKDNPRWAKNPNECLVHVAPNDIREDTCAQTRDEAFNYRDLVPEAVKRLLGVQLLDLTDLYCNEDICPAVIGGVNAYRDHHHLTVTYTKTMAPFVYPRLVEMDALKAR